MRASGAPPFSGVVLAGGGSTRMGRDKATIRLGDGLTMAEQAARALTDAGACDVAVVGGDAGPIEALGLAHVPDRYPGQGPLGGVITGLSQAAEDIVVILACDHVSPSHNAVRLVVEALGRADVAVPVIDGRHQTMHAAWNRRVLPHVVHRFETGARSLRQGMAGLAVVEVAGGDARWFADADTPDELPNHRP